MLGRNTWLVAKLRCSPHGSRGIPLAIREIHSIEAKCVLILLFLFSSATKCAIVRENVRSARSFAFPFPGGGKSILRKYFSVLRNKCFSNENRIIFTCSSFFRTSSNRVHFLKNPPDIYIYIVNLKFDKLNVS